MAWSRSGHLAMLGAEDIFDAVVVGGGITGCGVALDLSARGLRVALVEQTDFAAGTSSRSTKLFHGGIRYLPQFEFKLIAEGLREQQVLSRNADYLFHPLEFVIPLYRQYGIADAPDWAARGRRASLALRVGLILYDLLGGRNRPGAKPRRIHPEEVLALVPSLRHDGLRVGFVYADAQTDDARLVLAVIRTAVERYQTVAVTGLGADELIAEPWGYSVVCTDTFGGHEVRVRARTVVAATGAFRPPALLGARPLEIVASKGVHLVVPKDSLGITDRAVVLPETEDDRVLYIIPWQGHALVGTTDTPYAGDPRHPTTTDEDVAYLVKHVRRYLEVPDFTPLSTFAGLRALADTGEASTAQASREHVIAEPSPGYVQVAGGKLTTYRRISAEAAAAVIRHLGLKGKSPTEEIPLVGAGGDLALVRERLAMAGFPVEAAAAAIGRYGGEATRLTDLTSGNADLLSTLSDGQTTTAEVVHAVRFESASTVSDFTLRRTRLAWLTTDHGRKDQETIAALMAVELGWSADETVRQVNAHEAELTAEGL
jgi:glycerol-3-phosphate dehydrogenase